MTKKRKKTGTKHWSPAETMATSSTPALRFSPTAWAKLLFLRDYGDTEVGGFGISASHDLLLINDIQLVQAGLLVGACRV